MQKSEFKKIGIRDVQFGKDVVVIEPVNLYQCSIGDNSFIGPFVEIQKNVSIGANCRIQSHSFICELVKIGNNCFISHGVMFINDLFKDGKPENDIKNGKKRKSVIMYQSVLTQLFYRCQLHIML